MTDVCIIGAGPAGLTAAIYVQRAGRTALLIEKNVYGGQIVNAGEVENYPAIKNISGYEFSKSLYEQAVSLGARLEYDNVNSIEKKDGYFTVSGNMSTYDAKSVIIASGVKRRQLSVPGENEYIGMGVSYCATCDGMFFKNKKVAVVGGGNTAIDDALFLSNYCAHVYLLHRRDEFRAEKSKLILLKNKQNVSIIVNAAILSIEGSDNVSSVKYRDNVSGSQMELEVSGVFIAVGQAPDTEYLSEMAALDSDGYVASGEDCSTDIVGLYVAGDCRSKAVRQLTTATADGTVAALNACKFLENL